MTAIPLASQRVATAQPGAERILAAIDVGTNSLHMVIVRVDPRIPSFTIISREKETVRLGEYCDKTDALTEAAMQRATAALERFLLIAERFQAESVVAVATSAVREAPNGVAFLQAIEQKLGLVIDLISGQEEARRIYLGVLSALEFQGQPHVIIDIGGGSTELILGDGHEPQFLRSVKVGAVRLTRQFLHSDPPSSAELRALREYIRGMVEHPLEQIKALLGSCPVRLVGTSGTIEAMAVVEARQRFAVPPARLHGYELSFAAVRANLRQLSEMPLERRAETAGLLERRAEILLAGGLILAEVMELLGADRVLICERALREGLIVDWMLTHGLIEDRLRYQGSVRQRHVLQLARKYQVEVEYAERVAAFALSLFDQTRGLLHQWGDTEREFLWAAAILHNCGHFVSHGAHHKHSYYLIRNGEMLGFNEEEIELIANLARYHRKSPPKRKHENFVSLASDEYRQIVLELSPMLRLATALDRRHMGSINHLRCELLWDPITGRARELKLHLQPQDPSDDCALELWSLEYKKEVFEEQFDLRVTPLLEAA